MSRESRVRTLYVFVAAAGLLFSGLLVGALLVERSGPSQGWQGIVTERASGSKTVETCRGIAGDGRFRSCSETEIGTFTVIGEREDGTPWAVVNEGAYRATSIGQTVEVETSSVTGRVVGLRGVEEWHVSESSSALVLAWAFFGMAMVFVGLGEVNRRRRSSALTGAFRAVEFVAVVPAVLVAVVGVWFALYDDTRALGLVSSGERTGGFLAAGSSGQERVSSQTIGGTLFTTVPLSAVAEQQRPDPGSGVIAIPITADRAGGRVASGRLTWSIRADDLVLETVRCPSGTEAFPSDLGPDFAAGFLCFDAFSGQGALIGFLEIGPVGSGVGERFEFDFEAAGR